MLAASVLEIGAAESGVPVAVNRTLPRVSPPRSGVSFPPDPTPTDFLRARLFGEPLVPIGAVPSRLENAALASAVVRYSRRTDPDDFAALTGFREQFPESPWSASLLLGLGHEYYHTGHYSLALDAWEKAWPLAREATDSHGKAIGDRAAGELATMYARLGRMTELEALLKSLEGRVLVGPSTENISGARAGLSNMKERPEIAFRCGPLALHRIMVSLNPTNAGDALVIATASTRQGTSLDQVADLSRKLGLNYRMAFRSRNASFAVPAVVHWKVGHYAAILRQDGERYLVQDPTFRNDVWITRKALEEEASGFFLIPPGELASGWRAVEAREAGTVWGKGNTGDNDKRPHTPTDPKTGCGDGKGMAVASVHLMMVNLHLHDQPVGYQPPIGPAVRFDVRYNHREAFQPAIFTYSNFGPKWTCDWISYITDNPLSPAADVQYFVMGGGTRVFTGFNPPSRTFSYQQFDQTRLTRTAPGRYEMISADGSKKIFNQSDDSGGSARKVFLTDLVDPSGNTAHLTYDAELRLVAISDAIGQVTTIAYGHPLDPLKITRVTDPFGRFATFDYDGVGRLKRITDVIGLASEFAYEGTGDFINVLTTPYGVTAFSRGESGTTRWLETRFPDGERERVEYNQTAATGMPASDPPESIPLGMATLNNYLQYRNTFFWSKIACATAYGDYSKAKIYHWLHTADFATTSGILESIKEPLEGRVWYDYVGQSISIAEGSSSQPAHVGRVLDDGSTQLRTFEYNGYGQVTNSVDPVGRTFSYTYSADGIDLLEMRQTRAGNNELLMRSTYNAQHQPLTQTDAAGQTTVMTYNARGQSLSRTNPRGETTTYSHDVEGRLLAIDHPLPGPADSTSYTYDVVGRVRTRTDSDGDVVTTDYDALDRSTRRTYPDGTFELTTFNRLDRASQTDRAGRITHYGYDAVRRTTRVVDPLGRQVLSQWCSCGDQKSLTDAMGRTTQWHHDVQNRLVAKEYADGSQIRFVHEKNTGRLFQSIDEKGQIRQYEYNRDDTVRSISYPNAAVPTATVRFVHDLNHQRLVSMTDGIGMTRYSYHDIASPPALGAGLVSGIEGPWPGVSVTYAYDQLGRAVSRAINGVAATVQFDAAGRVTNSTNALGAFTYSHDGVSGRVLGVTHSGGFTTGYHYLGTTGDHLLDRITHTTGGTPVSEFTYVWDVPKQRIAQWTQQSGLLTPKSLVLGYDAADQLISGTLSESGSVLKTYVYAYDPAGNRLSEQIDATIHPATYNALNQATATISDPATATTYQWDAENRLVALNRTGGLRTEFLYDGMGHRVGIRELTGGIETSLRRFVWCDESLAEERSAGGAVTRRFLGEGVKVEIGTDAGIYLYSRDHLGSVRELVDGSGGVRARYEYDPYGRRSRVAGDLESDFGFTGHYVHAPTGLLLPRFREYDTDLGRWLSRDPVPMAEHKIGLNLYQYVNNSPVNRVDPYGLVDRCAVCELAKEKGLLKPSAEGFREICYGGEHFDCLDGGGKPSPGFEIGSVCEWGMGRAIDMFLGDRCPRSGGPSLRTPDLPWNQFEPIWR